MSQDGELPKSVDKGKGKAIDGEPSKSEEIRKDKDGKPLANGKKEDETIGGKFRALMLGSLANASQLRKSSVKRINN